MSDWVPVSEATRRYGLSRATVYRLIAEGRVKRAKRAGDVRAYVSAADLKEATTLRPTPQSSGPERVARKRAEGHR